MQPYRTVRRTIRFQSLIGRLQTIRKALVEYRERKGFNPSQVGYKRYIQPSREGSKQGFNPSQVGYKPTMISAAEITAALFQSLIGRLQTIEVDGKEIIEAQFQSLIGRLQTLSLVFLHSLIPYVSIPHRQATNINSRQIISKWMLSFNPSQVGYKPPDPPFFIHIAKLFQSLIGRLQTAEHIPMSMLAIMVSIPHRQATNKPRIR